VWRLWAVGNSGFVNNDHCRALIFQYPISLLTACDIYSGCVDRGAVVKKGKSEQKKKEAKDRK